MADWGNCRKGKGRKMEGVTDWSYWEGKERGIERVTDWGKGVDVKGRKGSKGSC